MIWKIGPFKSQNVGPGSQQQDPLRGSPKKSCASTASSMVLINAASNETATVSQSQPSMVFKKNVHSIFTIHHVYHVISQVAP